MTGVQTCALPICFLWKEIEKNIIHDFLAHFKTFQIDSLGITARMPIEFVQKYVLERDTNWDIAIYGGRGAEYKLDYIKINKEERQIVHRNGYYEIKNRQVSTGSAESIALPEDQRKELGSNRNETRNTLENPLLMLHILETEEDKELAAFGISFPGNVLSADETIKLTINTVYYKNLLEFEAETDD